MTFNVNTICVYFIQGTDDNSEEDDEDSKKRKKKREAAKKSLEVVGAESFPEKKGVMRKKSVQWSNIFGIDRKKKRSNDIIYHRFQTDRKKRVPFDDEEDYDYGRYLMKGKNMISN